MNIFSKETEELLTSMLLAAINDPKSFEEAEALYAEVLRTPEEFYLSECNWLDDFTKDQMVDELAVFLFKKDPQNDKFMQQMHKAEIKAKAAQEKAWEKYYADSESYDYWDVKNTYNEAMEGWIMELDYLSKQYKPIAEKQIESIRFCEVVNYKGEGEGIKPVFLCSKMRMFNGKYDYE